MKDFPFLVISIKPYEYFDVTNGSFTKCPTLPTVILVHGHLVSSEGMTYGANNQNATMLGGLFASVLGSDGRQGPAPSRLALLCSLLNLSRKLAQTPLVNPAQV